MKKGTFFFRAKGLLALIAFFWISIFLVYKPWNKNQVVNDVVSYYAYLPATFIHHDLKLRFTENNPAYKFKFWPETAANGGKFIKTTMGLSIMYAPFFLVGHAVAIVSGAPQDGFSVPYQVSVMIGGLFYFLAGLYFLQKVLLRFFTEKISSLAVLSVVFGTNLLWYFTLDNLMSHQYVFALLSFFTWQTLKWHDRPGIKTAIFIGISAGMLVLIRPPMIFCALIFLLFNVYNLQTLKEKCSLLLRNKMSLLLIVACAALVFLPQCLYWKYVTDQWLLVSYVGERFYFDRPHLPEGLFGFRKGWLLYTPLMLFAVIGLFSLRKKLPQLFVPVTIILFLTIYVFLSWWAWWYGGSFGNRTFIDWYALFIFPVAALYSHVFSQSRKFLKAILLFFVFIFVALNMFQAWQYSRELIHYDSMTAKAYRLGFFATSKTKAWEEALSEPDYARAKQGLPEAYFEEEIRSLRPEDIVSLKGSNGLVISCEINGSKELYSSKNYIAAWEKFSVISKGGNRIALMANNKKYVCADHGDHDKLKADKDNSSTWETYELIYLGNSRVALRSDNGKYVGIDFSPPYALTANNDSITSRTTFRIYIN